ncbi:unnamed protein product [Cladocopium goreaui]|uniref:KAP family P-loop domain protein n=1 Tax=Cladocopium goreaui TaxID=2562237 RepID=A0A9P1CU59_9DINO|nr:unnamed protein product [Cladocopium goreaui]
MRTDQFLAHHGVTRNPFAEEDAQTDQVFKALCVDVRHPAWDKVYGDPADPATSLVFGEKGAGKTAMRLQVAEAIERHNDACAADADPPGRVWVVEYDDFNPLLDRFADRLPARKGRDATRVLEEWKLWDHMDGVLSIAVTDLLSSIAIGALIGYFQAWDYLSWYLTYLVAFAGWVPYWVKWAHRKLLARGIAKNVRVLRRDRTMTDLLMRLRSQDLENQPLPNKPRTDDRYELLGKLQGVLRALGYGGVMVLVDRVDEPHLLGGRVEHIRDFVWSMLDNKFLRQPGIGFKLLLPAELLEHLNREDRDFHQRARLDKQNVVPSLDWTADSLRDLAAARLAACSAEGATPTLRDMIDPAVSDSRIAEALRTLRTPRHLFKFLFRLISTHCNTHTESDPVWRVGPETFEAVLAVYAREQASIDRGLSAS